MCITKYTKGRQLLKDLQILLKVVRFVNFVLEVRKIVYPEWRFESETSGLQVRCSTNEATWAVDTEYHKLIL